MVNNNIQGAIPLAGQGYVAKNKGNWAQGQYKRLNNVEINDDGALVNRRNIKLCANSAADNTVIAPLVNTHGFIGFLRDYAIVTSATEQKAYSKSFTDDLWAPTSLPVTGVGGWAKLHNCFQYNNRNYWISSEWDPTADGGFGETKYFVHDVLDNELNGLDTITYASLTHTNVFTYDNAFNMYVNAFMQGDRLWIVTAKRLYFSKATDPKTFTVPDGGFFNFPDTDIKFAFALKDSIYILCDNSVFMLTYTDDPNTDAFVRKISDSVGGDWGCVHRDTPYFVNSTGLWSINGTYIEQAVGQIFERRGALYNPRVYSFEDYLIITRTYRQNYAAFNTFDTPQQYYYDIGPSWQGEYGEDTSDQFNVFFLNTKNGSMHTVDFKDAPDALESVTEEMPGYVTDIIVNPNKDFFGSYALYMLTNKFVEYDAIGDDYTYNAWVHFMVPEREQFVYDKAVNNSNLKKSLKPKYQIEIDSYSPDGSEYFVKKFRNLELMGVYPFYDFGISYGFDNQDLTTPIDLSVEGFTLDDVGTARPHYPARIPINQRARSISILLAVQNEYDFFIDSDPVNIYDQIEISDIRLLWGYTGRGPTTKSPTQVT